MHSQATDEVGNVQTAFGLSTFFYDAALPTSTVSTSGAFNAAGWSGSITGMASDNGGGDNVSSVAISIFNGSLYFDGSGFNNSSETFLPVTTGTTSWAYTLGTDALTSGMIYTVHSQATDQAGNVQTSYGSSTFVFDTALPTSTVSTSGAFNAAGWSGSITGMASDNGGGDSVSCVAISIFNGSFYFDGSGFNNSSETYLPVTSGTSSWSYALAVGALTSGTTYTVHSQATDEAGNVQTTFGSSTFLFDTALPTSTVSTSGAFNAAGWSGSIAGMAGDNGGGDSVSSVTVSIFNGSKYFDGAGFNNNSETYLPVTSGMTSWSYTLAGSALTSGTTYTVHSQATDQAGNNQTNFGVSTFTYDSTVPALGTNAGLTVNEGGSGIIGSAQLSFTDSDDTAAYLTYNVTSGPAHGEITKNGLAVATFTQADLNGNLISYVNDNSLVAADSFAFTVQDAVGNVTSSQTFTIAVTLVNPNFVALCAGNVLDFFDAAQPGTLQSERPVTGLLPGERLLGIDKRGSDGLLYAVSDRNRVYTINPATGAATVVSFLPIGPNDGMARTLSETLGLYEDAGGFYQIGGNDPKWLRGQVNTFGNPWYFILPTGDFYAWNGTRATTTIVSPHGGSTVATQTVPTGQLLATFGTYMYENPQLIISASQETLGAQAGQAEQQEDTLGLYVDAHGVLPNFYGGGEKWLRGVNNSSGNPWYFILPTGGLYAWNGGATATGPTGPFWSNSATRRIFIPS